MNETGFLFSRAAKAAESWLKPMLLVAYHTGMHKGEICSLRWGQVDVQRSTIRLKSGDAKTVEGRVIPMNQALTAALKSVTRYQDCPRVFVNPVQVDAWQASPTYDDPRYHAISITHAFAMALNRAQVKGATFHDLWHTFVTTPDERGLVR